MDDFKLFEKVTGRISLKTGELLEVALVEACRKTGAHYHEAADGILITGTLEQVVETRQFVFRKLQDDGRRRKKSSSSGCGECVSTKHSGVSYKTSPSKAKYIERYHDDELKNIERECRVEIIWTSDYTKVHIKPSSSVNHNGDLFKMACEKFSEVYQHFDNIINSISFNVSRDGASYSGECLKTIISSLPQHVSRVILEQSLDGCKFTIWGTNVSLSQANQWIREQLGVVERPRSLLPKGPSKDDLIHETANKLKVVVYQGDLTRANADILVNACNKHLDHAGGVSYAICKAGGPAIQKESDDYVRKHGALTTGDVAVTGSGYLQCKNVIHAVGPQWKKHGREKCEKLFHKLFMNIFIEAQKLGAKSIAMPAISSGIYGVPKEVCAQAVFSFVEEIDEKLASDPSAGPFEIILVNIDGEIVKTFSAEFNKWRFKGKKVQRRHSLGSITRNVEEKPVETKTVDDMCNRPKMKASLVALREPLQTSFKDDHSLDTSSVPSKIKRGRSSPGSAVSVTSGHQVKIITAGATTSSTAGVTTVNQSNPSSTNTDTPHTAIPSQYGATARNKYGLRTTVRYDQNGVGSHSLPSRDDAEDCTICQCPFTDPTSLPKCGHTFCKPCIERAFTYQKKCPICQEVYGITEGNQPDGTMGVKKRSTSLPGYERCGSYVITYAISGGIQGNNHPKPGHKFTGTTRVAYLPANEEGRAVLEMLKKAFEKKLIFTVGRSNTTGLDDCVTWNDIHHKTSVHGGPLKFGYPDPEYLKRVKDELKAKGIVPEEEIQMTVV